MSPGDRVTSLVDHYWTAVVLAWPRNGTVLIRWATGPLAGREARVLVATVRTYATITPGSVAPAAAVTCPNRREKPR